MNRHSRWWRLILAGVVCALVLPTTAFAAGGTIELQKGWRMISSWKATEDGSVISRPSYDASGWYPIAKMPATVLQVLEDDGVYPNLYYGMNLTTTVPSDLYRQDWWYRTAFAVPAGSKCHWLIFNGINYRGEIWLNGERIAGNRAVAGMYNQFEFNVTGKVKAGAVNTVAVRVTPEQAFQDINGVELADSWFDWINWKYLGLRVADKRSGISFVPDRNAGIWKQVYLRTTGPVQIKHPYVSTDLPLPATNPASLTVYCNLKNGVAGPVGGTLHGEISRMGKPTIRFQQSVTLAANEEREIVLSPASYRQLSIGDPDLWWPYQWGKAALYQLKLDFTVGDMESDVANLDFGIRKVTQHRDISNASKVASGGDFYFKVNGVDFLVRGADYTPDLLYRYDEAREEAILSYVKDMGLNLLRWESKISSEHVIELADREGIPVMLGWMCCNQWEKWNQWDAEDHRVARDSLRAQIYMLRAHPSVFMWANGSDGLPPEAVRNDYNRILHELHWQNAVVDTVAAQRRGPTGERAWDGIHMEGPYSWRPPSYWFDARYRAAGGACAEQGDNEQIPPLESLKKFIPADKLWPINDWWYYHAGSNPGNSTLQSIRKIVDKRYGPSAGVAEFAEKAQLAHYENTRAQFESFAAAGWSTHKMTMYWMLNSHWPSFFGHIIDYYLKPGGAFFGAKKGLKPISIVYDYYASGDRSRARIFVANQSLTALHDLSATVIFINLDGTVKYSQRAEHIEALPLSSVVSMEAPRVEGLTSTFFVRCRLNDSSGSLVAENLYWQSITDDDVGPPGNDRAFDLTQVSWADFLALNQMPPAQVDGSARAHTADGWVDATVTLVNKSKGPAFFLRAEVVKGRDGDEILPILWDDNYVTLFAGESVRLHARYRSAEAAGQPAWLRLHGYNLSPKSAPIEP
jgi:exo-1,4-beta-D-glucosaminidase